MKSIITPPHQTILDACCGGRMFYFDKEDPRVLFQDIRDDEDPRLWWHERIWLSRRRYTKPTCFMFVSKRKFFGKVRLVMYRDGCLADTWRTIADSITVMESKGRKKQ